MVDTSRVRSREDIAQDRDLEKIRAAMLHSGDGHTGYIVLSDATYDDIAAPTIDGHPDISAIQTEIDKRNSK